MEFALLSIVVYLREGLSSYGTSSIGSMVMLTTGVSMTCMIDS